MLDERDLQLLGNLLDQKLDEKLKPIQADISELKEDVSVLKAEMKEVKEDIAELKEDVSVLKAEMKEVKQDIAELKEDVRVLKEDVSVLKVEMKEVKQDIAELKEDVSVLKQDVNVLKQDSEELKRGVRKLNDDLRNLRIDHSRVEMKMDAYYAKIENTYVKEKEDRSNYQEELRKSLDQLIHKAKLVCPLYPYLVAYMSLQVAHEGWNYA